MALPAFQPDENQQGPTVPAPIHQVEPPRPASSELNSWEDVLPDEFKGPDGQPDKERLTELAIDIWDCIQGAISARDLILNRIQINEDFYHNAPAKAVTLQPYDGAPNYHIPLVGPRLQQRKASWVDTVTSPDKYFYVTYYGNDEPQPDGSVITAEEIEEAIQDDLQFFLRAANYEEAISDIGETLMPANHAILWTTFHEHLEGAEWSAMMGAYAGFKFQVVHPAYFLAFPANTPSLQSQRMVGTEFERRKKEVEAKINSGVWIASDVIPSAQSLRTEKQDPGLQTNATTLKISDQMVHLVDCLMRYSMDGGDEKLYRVIADSRNRQIYRIEPFEDARPWFTIYRIYKHLNAFWSEYSPAMDGQAAQMMLNALINNLLWAIQYASRQSVLGKGLPSQDSSENLPPGAFIPVSNLAETQTLSSNFNPAGSDWMAEFVMRIADIAMKVPDTISGGSAKDETATAQQIKYQGFQLMSGADIKATNPAMVETAQLCLGLLYDNFASIWKTYGALGVLKVKNREWFKKPMIISVAGQKPKAAPQIQQQELSAALALIKANPVLASNIGLMLELTEKFVNQTSIEGKEDIIKQIKAVTADMGQYMAIFAELKQMGVTPQQVIQLVQAGATGSTQPGNSGIKTTVNFKDEDPATRAIINQKAGFGANQQTPTGVVPEQ